jgi:flagellar hook-length control protein FliK
MTSLPQLSGIDQGSLSQLLGPQGRGAAAVGGTSGAADPDQLKGLLDTLGVDPQDLSPDLQVLLAQLLGGGSFLPPAGPAGTAGGKVQPSGPGDYAQTLAAMAAGAQEAGGAVPGADGGKLALQPLPKALRALFQTAGAGAEADGLPRRAADAGVGAQQDLPDAIKGLSQAMPLAGAPRTPIPSQSLLAMPVPQPVGDPAWGAAIGERLLWMARGEHQQAELKISPPNLGPLEIKLHLNHDQASVSFVSHHALVRDALEAAIPRLREMLAEQQINLVQADVGAGQRHSGQTADPGQGTWGRAGTHTAGPAEPSDGSLAGDAVPAARLGLGLLDLFA